MRKILLATTALVGIAATSAAQAATSPLTVNIGGSTDFVAGNFAAGNQGVAGRSANRDFETLYDLDFSVKGKAGSGVEYGGILGLSNAPDAINAFKGTQGSPYMSEGYVWMSGAFGKVQLGDSHGATDLTVTTPTVGEGQILGRYTDFLDTSTFAKGLVFGVDGTDHSTNITYFTPKVGNENNKLQLGVSYIPQFYNYGSQITQYNSTGTGGVGTYGNTNTLSPYKDIVKAALAYTGNIAPVALKASASIYNGTSDQTGGAGHDFFTAFAPVAGVQDFTAFGIGAQAALNGFTLGGSYTDMGRYNAVSGQNKDQDQFTAGLKYEFSKVGVGISYLGGEGYANTLTNTGGTGLNSTSNYIKDLNTFGAGGTYTWAPGLTSNLDGVYFNQKADNSADNKGYVLLVSQKLAF